MATYTSADWHGCRAPADKLLNYLKPDDTLYFLGDSVDRGKEGMYLLDRLLSDPRVIFIKGNHEQLMIEALPYLTDDEPMTDMRIDDWFMNGGRHTWEDLMTNYYDKYDWYVKSIINMPLSEIYHSPKGHTVILEHSGFSPFDIPHRSHNPLWDRAHFYDEWDDGYNYNDLNPQTTYMVHGHTPVQYIMFEYGYIHHPPLTKEEMNLKYTWWKEDTHYIPSILRYCDGHKFCVDMCTIASGRVALLNLDTFEEVYFDENN